jgi:hypothetical protein
VGEGKGEVVGTESERGRGGGKERRRGPPPREMKPPAIGCLRRARL